MMQKARTYLVGGAVRDKLLKRVVTERDWVVVGATTELMLNSGFKQVGKDFPVFLHPETKEEYALARTERKSARGYKGFTVNIDRSVTLEEDLLRRDLTINAIAEDEAGRLIDPYNGVHDLEKRVLRHVSPAFSEDPLRVLRLARFYARYYSYGFTIADETKVLVREIIESGELSDLVPERVWLELTKVLIEDRPDAFFSCLRTLKALPILFPEVAALFGVPQTARYHPEIDSGIHTLMSLEQVARLTTDLPTRFAVLCHDFGKAITPKEEWPSHRGHEVNGLPIVEAFCDRLKVPEEYRKIALKVTEHHLKMHQIQSLKATTLLKLMIHLDVFRNEINLYRFLDACEADAKGRLGLANRAYPQRGFLINVFESVKSLDIKPLIAQAKPENIPSIIQEARIKQIKMVKN